MFGRVGEEAQALAQAHVPFEIIPGISSGIGGLAFAGIPITHRDYASGARLMSAHGKAGTMSDLDYAGMAHTRDTLIFYMGLQQLSAIVSGLMQAGRNPNTPIALVDVYKRQAAYYYLSGKILPGKFFYLGRPVYRIKIKESS